MANLIRSAKSGSDWSSNELLAYNIVIVPRIDREFFGEAPERLPGSISSELLEYNFSSGEEMPEKYEELLIHLDQASTLVESFVDDFASGLLRTSGYVKKGRVINVKRALNLIICGENRFAQADVSLTGSRGNVVLLVQEDKRRDTDYDPEPQVIAEAIAAFQRNNKSRKDSDLREINRMIIPCITMKGTFPKFYLVPVTEELNNCIATGQYPNITTRVLMHLPEVGGNSMIDKGVRKKILQCYESFKKFVDNLEEQLGRE
jgi:hypothetical protein